MKIFLKTKNILLLFFILCLSVTPARAGEHRAAASVMSGSDAPQAGVPERDENGLEIVINESTIYPSSDGEEYIYTSPYTGESYYSWGVERMGYDIYGAWLRDHIYTEEPVVVAVIDTGTVPCEETQDRILEGLSPYSPEGKGQDIDPEYSKCYHGTHVAGTILDCTRGLNIKVLPIRLFNSSAEENALENGEIRRIPDSIMIASLQYAIDKDVDVINLSFGCKVSEIDQDEMRARGHMIQEIISDGIVVVTSAGNDNEETRNQWPAYYEDCIVVSALQPDESIWAKSNYGKSVDVCAPGKDVRSNVPLGAFWKKEDRDNDHYADTHVICPNAYLADLEGTSMAAPHISALAAMLKLENPDRTPAQIEQYIKDYCVNMGDTARFGNGLPDISGFADMDEQP